MQIYQSLTPIHAPQGSAVALGYFDGVHCGHRAVLGAAVECARAGGLTAAAFTFELPGSSTLKGGRILSLPQKHARVASLGIEEYQEAPFDEFRALTPEDFVQNVLVDCFNAKQLFCGDNFTFGARAAGNVERLRELCAPLGIGVHIVPMAQYGGQTVSSTRIRAALEEGRLDDANAMLSAYNSDELQFIENVPVDEFASLLASGELSIADYIGTYYVCYNVTAEPFDDWRVRKAFTLAIDANYIVENVTQAGEIPATGFVPAGIYDAQGSSGDDFRTVGGDYWDNSKEAYEANLEEANRLLDEAGYEDRSTFPVVTYMYNTDDKHEAIGEALQNMWSTGLGVTVQLQNQDWSVFLETRKQGDYQVARNGWIADYNDAISFLDMWYTDGGNNDAQYSNPDYDAAIDAAKATSDPEERMKAFHEAEDILIGQDSVLAPIYFYTQPYMLNPDIDGMYYTPLGYFFFGYTSKK